MKYIDEFRDGVLARKLAADIRREALPRRSYSLMEFCGGHTHAIFRYGIQDLLPDNVRMIHGPGCPVCVLPIGRVDSAIQLARTPGVILCSYGDMLRVPGSDRHQSAQGQGGRGGCAHDLFQRRRAADRPGKSRKPGGVLRHRFRDHHAADGGGDSAGGKTRTHQFFGVFQSCADPLRHRQHPRSPEVRKLGLLPLDGFIGPAHVSTVIGSRPYEYFAYEYQRPVVIAGFEPLDVMQAILMLVRQLNEGRAEVENEFSRAVTRDGNLKAQDMVAEVFELRRSFEWRGLGLVPYSGLRIKEKYAVFDAERRFDLPYVAVARPQGLRMRRDHPWREKSTRLQAVRYRVHAGKSDWIVHGVVGRGMRRVLHLWTVQGT